MNYNPIASQYDSFERTAVTVLNIGYPAVMGIIGDVENRKILDYGCGTGTFSRILAELGAVVTGVDVSEEMIRVAQQNEQRRITYYPISSGGIGFLSGESLDHAVANFVLCTIPSKKEILEVLRSIHRVLKPGGRFVIMNSNWERSNGKEFVSFRMDYCENLRPGEPVTATIKSDPPMPMHDYFWSIDDYLQLIKQSGFYFDQLIEPIAADDHIAWLDERTSPPYFVISAKK